ncbi:hypothetical protein, partial [Burkholderia gladioli]|uniref:hypothetical protein n=1 Tax=Burkholderia gladioli TaxID=28095 RepID=UPI001F1D9A6E
AAAFGGHPFFDDSVHVSAYSLGGHDTPKSFTEPQDGLPSRLHPVQIDRALHAHNCQANAKHRIQKGDVRLKVRTGRSWEHYCVPCARKIIERDIEKLTALLSMHPPSDA